MAATFYATATNTDVPLWESRVNHSTTIRRATGSELLAELQARWANIIRWRPAFAKGDLVAYSDEEEPGRLHRDTLYQGKVYHSTLTSRSSFVESSTTTPLPR